MNWIVMLVSFYLLLGIERGAGDLLAARIPGLGEAQPALAVIIVAFIVFRSPARVAYIVAYTAGLTLDLFNGVKVQGQNEFMMLIGPNALGFLIAAYFISRIKDTLRPKHPLSLGLATLVMLVCSFSVALVLVGIRFGLAWFFSMINAGWYPGIMGIGWRHWALEILAALVSAVIAVLLAYPLYKIGPLFGFETEGRSSY